MTPVYFVGAGPGDPELITLKGKKLLEKADCVIYAGSLVNHDILKVCSPQTRLVDSSTHTLEEIIDYMIQEVSQNHLVIRLHSGDPSLYGAIQEQINELDNRGINYQVIPGVSSVGAVASRIKKEYTLPHGTQTLIITRMGGQTPVPESEQLSTLAAHRTSMVILLSSGFIDQVVEELSKIYPLETPIICAYRVTWPDERIIQSTLEKISQAVKEAGIHRSATLLIGPFLNHSERYRSYLYGEWINENRHFPFS
ncbi:precorrin-4 C(11)-methyltransferase [Atribacter laminatus]|uniref:Cobalt-precorrin-4 C(11)-methyltransferase n=1 Tax=Atribacter laminatus TaxID=2847778 RepID=A0A7T1AMV8_ATRLM|nr:precorrin-4 C(11)-methyltransferase [Atribacter laminatus]QPM68832.1 Cobalt-precorrin-4 C(11)-methyltransferase [Atribacter laminatus]